MPAIITDDNCKVCGVHEATMHEHHTVPQARGGKNSLTVTLCPTCHNNVHSQASYIIANIKNFNKQKEKKVFWKTAELEERARPLVRLLVEYFLEPVEDGSGRYIISVETTTKVARLLKLLKSDIEGCSSISSVVLYCIHYVANVRGLENATSNKKSE